tara:strand:- start:488 stop:763 length:276 start_codon:yes stop_codon:yes gene_type:complete
MGSLKFSDSTSEKGKKVRLIIHTINVFIVTFIYITLVHKVGAELGIDVNKPLREYDKVIVLSGFALMLFSLAILYGVSFKILSWIFSKLKI